MLERKSADTRIFAEVPAPQHQKQRPANRTSRKRSKRLPLTESGEKHD
jgi:hypothetical protein